MADLAGGDRRAVFSDDRRYRFLLEITHAPHLPYLNLCMLNPSTADELDNDPTVTRGQVRSRLLGFGGNLVVTNAYAYKATKPSDMKKAAKAGIDIKGDGNDEHIVKAASRAGMVICGWGAHCSKARHVELVKLIRFRAKKVPYALRFVHGGNPGHPLFLEYDIPPIEILEPNFCAGCGYEIAPDGGRLCGECACEDDCAP